MSQVELLVMASGNGSNFQSILDACADGRIPNTRVSSLIVNKKTAYSIQRAEKSGVPHEYFNLVAHGYLAKGEKDPARVKEGRARYDADLAAKIVEKKPDMVVLAGWMHVFAQSFLTPLEAAGIPVVNLHPAKPGCYDGANAIGRAFADFQSGTLENNCTGVMVHYVIAEVDRGQPILTQEVPVLKTDTLEDLEARMHSVEHELLVKAIAQLVPEIAAKKST
ncbi:Bifunctional purine biosynthetic protein ADE5,7 [Fusarium torreyae]|uniref:phosphoribosylglycinamide formyltransferase 1 n=1 Tax=Fusarium torreyae TaxID=1237075 RepID=A0A9W8SJ82_9HYPO|nr:Bifunctional purine biosynthetic protein ADE5,7 [Fusarium torreyae]